MGTGCAKCKKLYKLVEKAVQELGVEADVVKVEDIEAMLERGVMITPSLFIDGEEVSGGRIPGKDELKELISAAKA